MGPEPAIDRGDPPLVSVVIPTCNRRAVLERSLLALCRQSFPNFEVIVVDDGSIDNTGEMLDAVAAAHPRLNLRRLKNEANLGANASRNRGVRASHGEIVAFIDSDCIAEPDWLEKLVAGFSAVDVAAVTGVVFDPPAMNLYEMAFKGTNRVHGAGPASRLVGGNMAVRRETLLTYMWDEDRRFQAMIADGVPDVSTSGGCDEEGLYFQIRAAGFRQLVIPGARVLHDHHYSRQSFFRQAYLGGGSAAHLVYKYRLPPRIDLLPLLLTYLTLPLALIDRRLAWIPASFFLLMVAALLYNDLFRKAKTLVETLLTLPHMIAYYHVRLSGYVVEAVRLRLGFRQIERIRLKKR